jgi:hypothetical protein
MAVVTPTTTYPTTYPYADRIKVYIWSLTTADATGDALVIPAFADKTVQAYGTWGSGTLTFQGANHPTSPSWNTLTDGSDNDLTFTADKIEVLAQNPYQIRPVLSGSTGATITVIVVAKY